MTQNIAADPARTDPTGVFITGATGFGTSTLAQQFIANAHTAGASVTVIDLVGSSAAEVEGVTVVGTIASAVESVRAALSNSDLSQPSVIVVTDLVSLLHREDRFQYTFDQDKAAADRNNRRRDELEDLIADLFVFGADSHVFPIIVAEQHPTPRFVGRVQQASSGWAHFEFTSHGKGTLRTERDKSPFVLPVATTR
jgi:hypothetical protein